MCIFQDRRGLYKRNIIGKHFPQLELQCRETVFKKMIYPHDKKQRKQIDEPGAFFTDGQKVPEDIHLARAHTLISRAVALGEQTGAEYSDEYLALALGGMRADANG